MCDKVVCDKVVCKVEDGEAEAEPPGGCRPKNKNPAILWGTRTPHKDVGKASFGLLGPGPVLCSLAMASLPMVWCLTRAAESL